MSTPDPDSAFEKCVTKTVDKDGYLEITCKNNQWSTWGSDHESVERDARHYWFQYYKDGEYKNILK